jgi:phytoene synthase
MTLAIPALEAEHAYRECERITRVRAGNFFYGIRLLPRPKREAMCAVYAFARRVDDIGDGQLDSATQLSLLAAERSMLARIPGDGALAGGDPIAVAVVHAHLRYDLPLDALELLIDGVEMDVCGTRYDTFDQLVAYCRSVAGSIGRLCLAIFCGGAHNQEESAFGLADDLGVAMQLTNILRDVREDHARGRTYLPGEDLAHFGCEPLLAARPDRAAALIRFEAARAEQWFDRGMRLVDRLDSRSASCLLAMTGIYRAILARIAAEPAEVLSRRISLPVWEKGWLAARSLAGAHGAGGWR